DGTHYLADSPSSPHRAMRQRCGWTGRGARPSRDLPRSGDGAAAHNTRPHSRPLDGRTPHEPVPSPQLAGGCRDHRAIQSNQVGPRRPGSLERLKLENLREAAPDVEGFDLLDAAEKPTRQVGRVDMVARLIEHHST